MFRRNNKDESNKAKLEHKLYLARETPEPVFDLADCGLKAVPQGIYSLCRVFLKEVLRLEQNNLSSLSGGGQLKDLHYLKVLDLHDNAFVYLPDDIHLLKNLKELYLNNNQLKKLPEAICKLNQLNVLNLAENNLKFLPENIGELSKLAVFQINGNKSLRELPKSMAKMQQLTVFQLDVDNFTYPPGDVAAGGLEAILRYICQDAGVDYGGPDEELSVKSGEDDIPADQTDLFEAKIWTLENLKKLKLQEFLEIERVNEMLQKQEFELANAQKVNREKLLADITQQQYKFDVELVKIQQEKDADRFKLIEQVLEEEQNADVAIKQLLTLNREPLAQLLEQEQQEEERLLQATDAYNKKLRKRDILSNMQVILQQETAKFQQFHENRMEISKSLLEQELESDCRLSEIIQSQDLHKADLVAQLLQDSDVQKAAVATLLERGDARSWGLVQQVKLVESQLAALTHIEMDKRKLQIDQHINDLAEKRMNLSILLMDLLQQQKDRRLQLLSTLQTMETHRHETAEDFWLKQYQILMEELPRGLSEAQRDMDPVLLQMLLIKGVIHCLPLLARLVQLQYNVNNISDGDLLEAGVRSRFDRENILDAFQMYKKERSGRFEASAPVAEVEEASAPPLDAIANVYATECVICMDQECQVIFVPCGHFCCCLKCATTLEQCPMCRGEIECKIKVIPP